MRAAAAGGALALVAALVAGCGGDAEPSGPGSTSAVPTQSSSSAAPTPSASASPSSYLPVPAGVTLTPQGSDLQLGAPASVAWEPRQSVVGVLDIAVQRLERTTLKRSFVGWQIPEETRTATPYFVRASVTNRGETDLGGRSLPLYAVNGADTLLESTTFATTFRPCRDGVLPETFAPGATLEMCLVYFVPEGQELTGVSFRPGEDFDPVTWTGPIERAAETKTKAKTKKQ